MAHYLSEGTLLHAGSYRIVRFISSGGFGCTYEAMHLLLEDRVAIKEFFVQDLCERSETTSQIVVGLRNKQALVEKLRRKFIDEARGLRKLQHKGIVSVSDVFEENGTAYFVMDYVEGQSLSDRLKASGPLPEEEALKYIRQVCDALAYVHDNNRLHLDIKPGNIMIDGDDRAILIDFGASKQYDEVDGENTSTLMGKTPGYAPPEQMSNNVLKFLPSTDIYALGATLYKLLTGITPPDALQRISGEPMALLPEEISAPTRRAVEAALLLDKTARPQTIAAFLKLLDSKAKPAAVATPSAPAEEKTQFGPQEHVVNTVAKEEPTELDHEPKRPTPTTPPVPPAKPKPVAAPAPKSSAPKKKWGAWIVAACVLIGIAMGVFLFRSKYDYVGDFSEGLAAVGLNGGVFTNKEDVIDFITGYYKAIIEGDCITFFEDKDITFFDLVRVDRTALEKRLRESNKNVNWDFDWSTLKMTILSSGTTIAVYSFDYYIHYKTRTDKYHITSEMVISPNRKIQSIRDLETIKLN